MAKHIKMDKSNIKFLERADNAFIAGDLAVACGYINRVLYADPDNFEANLLLAEIYSELNQFDSSNFIYFKLLAENYDEQLAEALVSNFLQMGNMQLANFYNKKFNLQFDFSEYIDTDSENIEFIDELDLEDTPSKFRLVVSKDTKDGQNKIKDEADDGEDVAQIKELWNKLFNVNFENGNVNIKQKPKFKLIYPKSKEECKKILEESFKLFTTGQYYDALKILDEITIKNGKFYYEAQKNKAMNYLALNQINDMRLCVEKAMVGLPDDLSLKCYHYISLNLLEEKAEARRVFKTIKSAKPKDVMEQLNRLDVYRLAEYHEGIMVESRKILESLSYHPMFLLLHAKAQFNVGLKNEAVVSLKKIKKLYPYTYESDVLLDCIKSGSKKLSYSDIESEIGCTSEISKINNAIKADNFEKYLKGDNLFYFVLLSENTKITIGLLKKLENKLTQNLEKIFKTALLDYRINNLLKREIIKILLLNDKKYIKVVIDNIYKIVEIFPIIKSKNIPPIMYDAYYLAVAEIIVFDINYDKEIKSITRFANKLLNGISHNETENQYLDELGRIKNAEILKKVLLERAHIKTQTNYGNIKGNSRITYTKYNRIISGLEEQYRID